MKFHQRKSSNAKLPLDLDCDEILHQIGGTGMWQVWNFLLLCLPTMASGFLVLSFVFTGKILSIVIAQRFYIVTLPPTKMNYTFVYHKFS